MSANVTLVGPGELLAFAAPEGGVRPHDVARYIRDRANDRWIRTNNPFVGSWAPGYWEEVEEVPAEVRFDVKVDGDARWAAHRARDRVFVAVDRAAHVEVDSSACARVRRYERGVWAAPRVVSGSRVSLERKDIAVFELDASACPAATTTSRGPS